ncbi:MAG TPA: hypothetical protein VMS56_01655 [Thermoanaerobaculia bacterium]|nr:hypothetical protein [Thermoanaerobaculia bacterium]
MKPVKKTHKSPKSKTAAKSASRSATKFPKAFPAIPPADRRSTAAALLEHAAGWTGDDLDEVIEIVADTRTKARF